MKSGLSEFCVSTILDRRKLEQFALKGRGTATEHRVWKTGKALLEKALHNGARMPVIFSDAAYDTEGLLVWAILQKIDINEADGTSTIGFNDVKRVPGKHHRTELTLKSSEKPIASHFIRPYAICQTPPFLK